MKALVLKASQGALEFEDRKRYAPGPGEVLIRVRACGVCHGDLLLQQAVSRSRAFPLFRAMKWQVRLRKWGIVYRG
jgi:D-arabinose 1-dehydrogenase-like Zn-dependent alcohol dehydrogenase